MVACINFGKNLANARTFSMVDEQALITQVLFKPSSASILVSSCSLDSD